MKMKVVTNDRVLSQLVGQDPILRLNQFFSLVFPESTIKGPTEVPCGDVPYEVISWKIDSVEFRLLLNSVGHFFSIRLQNGMYWIISESTETRLPEIHDWDLVDFDTFINNNQGKVEDHIFLPFSDGGDKTYEVDASKLTCTCQQFKYKCSHFTIDKDERCCKHISRVLSTYPEYIPQSIKDSESNKQVQSVDGKVRYPRAVMDMYVADIKTALANFPQIDKFEICGSYRRLESMVSDLDFLLVLKPEADWNPVLDYFENVMGFQLVKQIGRGEAKAGYLVDGYVRVDFKVVPAEAWPYALLHFTGSKANNIELRRKANLLGYKLNEYGLFDMNENLIPGIETEKDIFSALGMPYKHPWDR